MRMGIDGTNAIGTLLALQSISTLAGNIGTAAAATKGNVPLAAAYVAVKTVGGTDNNALTAAGAIGAADGAAGGTAGQDVLATALAKAGLTDATMVGLTVQVYLASRTAAAAGAAATSQAVAGAQVIAFGYIKPNVIAKKADSPFVIAAGQQATLGPFFTKFLLNADQWDGYNAERKDLMKALKDNNVKNVVSVTGDIHAFFAGTVNDDYTLANGGTPVMVDLVTAGISSDSFFSYLKDAVGALSASLATLVFYPLSIPVTGLGTVSLTVNLLDYTMGKALPTAATLADSLRVQLRGALAKAGVPEAQLDPTTSAVLTGLQADAGFVGQLLPLAQQLAGLNSNPWLKFLNTDAQGYAVVTVTPTQLNCEFRQVNKLVGSNAPATVVAKTTTATVQKDVVAVSIA